MRARFGFKLALVFAVAAFALLGSTLFAQAGAPARRITAGATLPSTCISSVVIRDIFYKSGSNAGIYVCTAANTWTLQSGSADVVGPASATDNAIVRFNGTTGKLLQDSLVTISDLGAMDLPTGVQLTWGGVAEGLTYISGTGPRFEDASAGVLWTLNLQSLSGNRTVTVPDTGGTMALTSSNVATATALAANPTDCSAGQFATTIAANGDLTCAVVGAATNLVVSTGVGDGTGLQHIRAASCTTGGLALDECDTVITWPVAFADTSYSAVVTIDTPTNTPVVMATHTKTATQMTVTIVALGAGAASGTLNVVGMHD